ncbi:MAG: lysine--tRNA ligase [Dermatophilus congolensis]|nr:lysine--tRNA ligase [Dermatophilus congolensis]
MSGTETIAGAVREPSAPKRRPRRVDGLRAFLRPRSRQAQERAARILIAVFALALLATVILWIGGGRHESLVLRFVLGVFNIPASTSLVSIVILALILGALVRRKRVALVIVGVFQALGVLWSVVNIAALAFGSLPVMHGMVEILGMTAVIAVEGIAVAIGFAVVTMLWWLRPAFPARVTPGSWVKALAVVIVGWATALMVTAVLLVTTGPGESADRSPLAAITAVMRRSLGVERARDIQVLRDTGTLIPLVLEVLLSLTLVLALWVFLRSGKQEAAWNGDREVEVRRLVARHGQADSLGYFATRRDRSYAFSDDGQAVIAYRVIGAVALASGDPLGERGSWDSAVANWLSTSREYGWIPAVTSAGADAARYLAGLGFSVFPLGDEAVLHPERFTLDSTSMTPVRQAVTRARRAGLVVRIRRHAELTDDEMREVIALADSWRLGGSERGFSMALERLGDPADGRCLLVTAHHADGTPVGLLSFVPWGMTGLSLDVMRRSPDAPNGVTELMVAELMDAADDLGVVQVSLNFAVMRQVFSDAEELGASPIAKVSSGMLGVLDRFTQIESLYRNNDKYRPEWVTRYVCYEGTVSLVPVGVAIGAAEGFLPYPGHGRLAAHRTLSPAQLERAAEAERRTLDLDAAEPQRSDQSRHRLRHLGELVAAGRNPYAVGQTGGVPLRDHAGEAWVRSGPGAGDIGAHGPLRATNVNASGTASGDPVQVGPAEVGLDSVGSTEVGGGGVSSSADGGADVASAEAIGAAASVRVNARVRGIRRHGGVVFADLVDGSVTAQAVFEAASLGADGADGAAELALFGRAVDSGDVVVLDGTVGASRNGTPSLLVTGWQVSAKALQPVPFGGLTDQGQRARQRTLDLLVHPEAGDKLRARSVALRAVRETLLGDGYLEVETPILGSVHGGATARPFRTFSHAYGVDLVLRIAPELALKRLLAGDMGPVFEMGRNFRNEGADATHNPEFTVLEAYRPFADYTDMRLLTEAVIKAAARAVHGAELIPLPGPDGVTSLIDVSGEWPVVTVCDAVSAAVGQQVDQFTDLETLLGLARANEVPVHDGMGPGAVLEELYGELVEPATMMPTFYADFPVETSPLTGPHRSKPGLVERWDLVIRGSELGTAYSELNDPIEQRRRLTEQSWKAAAGDAEAMEIDEDFLAALEAGMPPAGGLGIGLDRLVMLLTESNIREVLTFPFVRPKRG